MCTGRRQCITKTFSPHFWPPCLTQCFQFYLSVATILLSFLWVFLETYYTHTYTHREREERNCNIFCLLFYPLCSECLTSSSYVLIISITIIHLIVVPNLIFSLPFIIISISEEVTLFLIWSQHCLKTNHYWNVRYMPFTGHLKKLLANLTVLQMYDCL